jgi:hypothetical protein
MQQLCQHWPRTATTVAILSAWTCVAPCTAAEPAIELHGIEPAAHTSTTERARPASAFDGAIDGLIVVVDCSETMAAPALRNDTWWALSIILDAAPDGLPSPPDAGSPCPEGIPTSVILFGHNPSVPKNLVEIVRDQRLVPLTWRSKSTYRRAVHQTTPSPNRVFLSGALSGARDVVLTSGLKQVAIVVLTDGQSPGEKLELAIRDCLQTPSIAALRVIRLGAPEPPAFDKFDSLFHGPRLSLGFARTMDELTDTLRPIAASLDQYRKLECDRERATVFNLEETLGQSNSQLEQAKYELNRRTKELAAEKVANQGLQNSVHTLTSKIDVLNKKTAQRARHDAETILGLENVKSNQKSTIAKLNQELTGIRAQVTDLEASDKSAKEAVRIRNQQAQELQTCVDKLRVENHSLAECARKLREELCCCVDAKKTLETRLKSTETELAHCKGDLKAVRAELCCCVDAKKNVESQLKLAEAEIGHLKTDLAAKSGELTTTQKSLDATKATLKSTEDDLESKKKDLAVCQAQAIDKNEKLIECHAHVCCLEKDLATAQATALGAARELACCKRDCPAAIFNSPMLAEGGTAPNGGAGPGGASGAAGGGAGGGGAGGSGGSGAGGSGAGGSGAGGSGAGGSGAGGSGAGGSGAGGAAGSPGGGSGGGGLGGILGGVLGGIFG